MQIFLIVFISECKMMRSESSFIRLLPRDLIAVGISLGRVVAICGRVGHSRMPVSVAGSVTCVGVRRSVCLSCLASGYRPVVEPDGFCPRALFSVVRGEGEIQPPLNKKEFRPSAGSELFIRMFRSVIRRALRRSYRCWFSTVPWLKHRK